LHGKSEFPLLNPKLKYMKASSVEDRNAQIFTTLVPLKEEILTYLGDGRENVAFYIEDLNSGTWVGWKERDPFVGASLLKVPVAMGVMKKIDSGTWTLDTRFAIDPKYKDEYFGELWKTPDNTEYTVRELLSAMLQNSDNTAANLFFDKLTLDERDDVYYFMGVTNPEASVDAETARPSFNKLSAKELATTFRSLYNATYITRKSSNYILDLLTKTEFDKVIPADIPKEVRIAHKVANFYNTDPNRPKNYHDCGITYLPEHPYLYCVMTDQFGPMDAQKHLTDIANRTNHYFEKAGN